MVNFTDDISYDNLMTEEEMIEYARRGTTYVDDDGNICTYIGDGVSELLISSDVLREAIEIIKERSDYDC